MTGDKRLDLQAEHPEFFASREAMTRFLFVRDEPAPVDLCLVLGSPTLSSMDPAIDLYHRGYAPTLLISGLGPTPGQVPESEVYREYAVSRGVPSEAILTEDRATNTRENFSFSAAIIEERFGWDAVRTVAVCGKPFHMRRALMTARRQWPGHVRLLMLPSSAPDDPPADTWWRTEAGRQFVLAELRAIAVYGLSGDIGGF